MRVHIKFWYISIMFLAWNNFSSYLIQISFSGGFGFTFVNNQSTYLHTVSAALLPAVIALSSSAMSILHDSWSFFFFVLKILSEQCLSDQTNQGHS